MSEKSNLPKQNLQKGQKLDSGFVILDIVKLEELTTGSSSEPYGIWAKHEKCEAEVFHVLNDDSENLFSFSFATFPEDNTGVAHILEHSVLCGSERYPLKDAFITLAQGSLQTFLNAFTFPDKTVYPASSTNEHDYFNLMSVYGDAVFNPLIPEWTFMQEGHRLEYNEDGELSVTGVVYNEMKGAYSSMDSYTALWVEKSVMPDTPYSFESGGDPLDIPQLTWEGLKKFHRTRYSPANCKIFLAGNIPTEKQLAFLNDEFFSRMSAGKACNPIGKAERWKEPKKIHINCPAGSELKPTIYLSWLCSDILDVNENIALSVLTEILFGHDGSPLTRVLTDSGFGEDVESGLDVEIRETIFIAGLKNVNIQENNIEKTGEAVKSLIMNELLRLEKEGIPPQEIEAALLTIEFSQREIRRSNGPFSLVWMRRALRTWLHGSKPWEGLLIEPAISKVKENLLKDNRYFESLIKKYLLDNPHYALVTVEPKEGFLTQQEETLSKKLANIDKNLSEDERRLIKEKSEELEIIQSEPNTPEALASIPHLSRNDLSSEIDLIHRRHEDLNGVPALCHDLHTNGITYFDLAFPVDVMSLDDYPWLTLFSGAVISVGLPGMDYGEVSSLMARTVGGFDTIINSSTAVKGTPAYLQTASGKFDLSGREWLLYRIKCLDEKIAPSLDLALRLILEADLNDSRRINDLILELKTETYSSFAHAGHLYASGRAGRGCSRSKRAEEKLEGISQVEFISRLVKMDTDQVIAKLLAIREKINGAGLIVNITGSSNKNACSEAAKRFSRFGAPVPRLSVTDDEPKNTAEVFASQSLQVGFAALALNAAPFDTVEQMAESVLTHQLSTGVLWEDIRMKGGAYGASINNDSIENCVSFATYRDPNPLRSLDVISEILKNNCDKSEYCECTEDNLVKNIIGCYSKETKPKTSAKKGVLDFIRFLYGYEDCFRKRKLERLINLSADDISNAFTSLSSRTQKGPVIIGGTKIAEQAAAALGTEVKILPV
ncbi:MAG: insulinase family protein [Treponema sp.]|nr:insulinase family protein [Treponema sp.]MCL2251025.1 insulinase family protein [Treponema sp.]